MVLRPHTLSIYRDSQETKLRHQVTLSELTAVARQRDPKRKEKHVFALFSPSKNYHLEAASDRDAHDWVEKIRQEARIEREEEELFLASPGGANSSSYQGFGRSPAAVAQSPRRADQARVPGGGYASSSDADALTSGLLCPSYVEYSGAELSDFSDTAGPAARLSALSLAPTDPGISTSSAHPPVPANAQPMSARPALGSRSASQTSPVATSNPVEEERVIHQSWIYLLKTHSGVRQWKKVWLVVRPKGLALYKTDEEYSPLLILPMTAIIDAVEINPISRSKSSCMQVISDERNYRFCALDEESLAKGLGALKSLLAKRRARRNETSKVA